MPKYVLEHWLSCNLGFVSTSSYHFERRNDIEALSVAGFVLGMFGITEKEFYECGGKALMRVPDAGIGDSVQIFPSPVIQGLKLFRVDGERSFGDNYFYTNSFRFMEIVVAGSPEEAIEQVWKRMEVELNTDKEASVRDHCLCFPRNQEAWQATEVKVEGSRIKLEPEA